MYIKVSWVRNHTSRSTGQTFQIQGAYNYQGNFPFLGQLLLLLCFCFSTLGSALFQPFSYQGNFPFLGQLLLLLCFCFFNSWFCSVSAIQLSWQLSIFRSTIGSTIGSIIFQQLIQNLLFFENLFYQGIVCHNFCSAKNEMDS